MQLDETWLRQQRATRAWSQEHLARASGLGLRTIQRIESTGVASAESALALAAVFDASISEIVVRVDPPVTDDRPIKKWHRRRLTFATAILSTFFALLFIGRTAVAEQVELAIAVSVNGATLDEKSVVAETGQHNAQQFGKNVRTVVSPELVEIAGTQKLAISMQIFEVNTNGGQTLIGSPELLYIDGANWEIKVDNAPSGKIYRLVVQAQELSG